VTQGLNGVAVAGRRAVKVNGASADADRWKDTRRDHGPVWRPHTGSASSACERDRPAGGDDLAHLWPAHPILGKMMGRLIALAGPLFALPERLGNVPVL
jgi:hypothetical protein